MWGDPDSQGANPLLDINSTVELYREVLGSLYRTQGGAPNVRIGNCRWVQPTDDNRLGRLLVLDVGIGVDVTDEPYFMVPVAAAPATPGVSVDIALSVEMDFPDGSSTVAGPIDLP